MSTQRKANSLNQPSKQSEILNPHTPCKDCVFALYADNGQMKTQTGCLKGKLDVFRKREEVIEATDGETEFSIVNGRVCQFYRHMYGKWASVYKTLTEREVRVEEEVRIAPAAYIFTKEDTTLAQVKVTLENLLSFGDLVHSITLFLHPSTISANEAYRLMSSYPDIVWNINQTRLDHPEEDGAIGLEYGHDPVGFQLAVATQAKKGWTMVAEAGRTLPTDTLTNINTYINEKLERFGVYGEQEWHGLVYNNSVLARLVDGPGSQDWVNKETEEKFTFDLFMRIDQVGKDFPESDWLQADHEKVSKCV